MNREAGSAATSAGDRAGTPQPGLIQDERLLVRNLQAVAAARAESTAATEAEFAQATAAAQKQYQDRRQQITADYESERRCLEESFRAARSQIASQYRSESTAANNEYAAAKRKIASDFQDAVRKLTKDYDNARWEVVTLAEAASSDALTQLRSVEQQVKEGRDKLASLRDQAGQLLSKRGLRAEPLGELASTAFVEQLADLAAAFEEALATAETRLNQLDRLRLPKLFQAHRHLWALLVVWLAGLYPSGLLGGWLLGPACWSVAVLVIGGTAARLLRWLAGRQVARIYLPFGMALSDGQRLADRWLQQANEHYQQQRADIQRDSQQKTQRLDAEQRRRLDELNAQRDRRLQAVEQKYPRLLAQLKQRHDRDMAAAQQSYRERSQQARQRYQTEMRQTEQSYAAAARAARTRYEQDWQTIIANWKRFIKDTYAAADQINRRSRELFPSWFSSAWRNWRPPTEVPPVIRFGEFMVRRDQIPHALPTDRRLRTDEPSAFVLPAFIGFPTGCSMLLLASDGGRATAVQAVQNVMLRMLTGVPAGKVRFTIIDPVGLGENFAAFMHLADYDERLVTSRIWTEPQHIEQRLTDLTEHMENVIQKYLRNEFETIEQYNARAGEVAEPFRILVVANFPVNFSEAAVRRLVSIASSGARCGVYTLLTVDAKQRLPHGCELKDLQRHAVNLIWRDGQFHWKDPDFESYGLTLDSPPPADFFTRTLQVVGREAKEASRVEVPFSIVVPEPGRWWSQSSRTGIEVPLGRAGATKLQYLRLGAGTAQHVLIAGKTGSGKSTLLHALITSVALRYRPEEVELYLVDFKKGVEFKDYATHQLPHARVVAIESEREFGLSVLHRLDAEMKRRGDLFRAHGVQDVNGYRQGRPEELMPRVLLIVDEFQEFFVEDDRIAQEAGLLLDRLVRQGRAFGIHVHLGSQTLSGAYALARSTIGQMAVRIALQCSDADAHLILSDENTAARLLSRPGEAIYNDANGLVEGNNFFQVVWLPDHEREECLRRIAEHGRRCGYQPPHPQIVFEGNVPADLGKNHLLDRLLHREAWPQHCPAVTAWLGEAVEIKDPTAAVFRRQAGSNLVIIGQHDQAAQAMMLAAVCSAAAQHPPPSVSNEPQAAQFYVVDGTPAGNPRSQLWPQLARLLPHPVRLVQRRDLAALMAELAQEVQRRQETSGPDGPALYLLVYDIGRLRALRRDEDDFGFSRSMEDKPASPAQQLASVLREGPECAVHTLVWCDTLNNLNRTFDRQTTREFEMRVLFQMSAADSSTLIDTPLAAKLGRHRALLYSEEHGGTEKFRPYGLPDDGWLQWFGRQLQARAAAAGQQS